MRKTSRTISLVYEVCLKPLRCSGGNLWEGGNVVSYGTNPLLLFMFYTYFNS